MVLAAVLIALSGRYGYHRDELYFLACGQHLAWGYPDQPPLVPLIARLMSDIAPGSLVVLRLPSAVASFALVMLSGLLARELGAGRAAQVLAAIGVATAPLVIGAGHLLSTTTIDLPFWALFCLVVARTLRTGNDRLWIVAGLVAGLGLFGSDLLAAGIFALAVGLAVAGPRRPFRTGWLYLGGVIAGLLWLPYLIWQASHGWPELSVASGIANGASGTSAPRWQLIPEQIALLGPFLTVISFNGLLRLLREASLRWCRALGVAYLVLIVVFLVSGGKPYYLAGMVPLLAGAGAQPAMNWLRSGRLTARRALVGLAALFVLVSLPVTLPLVPAGDLHHTQIVKLNYDAGETLAWPTFVREIAAVNDALPAAARHKAIVLASNYGEAGAVDHYGPAVGLPAAYSGHMSYYYWGPPPAAATVAIAVGFGRGSLAPYCGSLRLATYLNNHLDVNDDEQGAPVWVCQGLRSPWSVIWPRFRDFG